MRVPKVLLLPQKNGFLAQNGRIWPAQNWHFWSFWARPCRLIWCPVGGLVGGCDAGCISQDTYLLYHNRQTSNKSSHRISICECVRSIINFHPRNQDVDFDMLEIFVSFQCTECDENSFFIKVPTPTKAL